MHIDPSTPLPDEILDDLDFSEIPDTLRVWNISAAYYTDEPSTEEFEYVGREMWLLIDQSTQFRLKRFITWQNVAAMAACIALILSVGILLMQQPTSVTAPLGEQLSYQLPDGSTLLLNSGTRFEYSKKFGDTSRKLTLNQGEIFLNVKPSSIPFVVESFDAETRVLGTSFNVRSWPDEINAATNVSVESGKVRVIPSAAPDISVTLEAGESARIQPDGQVPLVSQISETSNETSNWTNGEFKFSSYPLGNVAKEIERRYDVKISIQPPDLESLTIGILKEAPESAEEIIRDICALNCEYRVIPGGFVLTPR